jgi:hypothetical protein
VIEVKVAKPDRPWKFGFCPDMSSASSVLGLSQPNVMKKRRKKGRKYKDFSFGQRRQELPNILEIEPCLHANNLKQMWLRKSEKKCRLF